MFSIFKKKKEILKDIIPQGYIDIHSHIMFGLDDGAKSIEDTEFLLQSFSDFGFGKSITTPHTIHTVWDNTSLIIKNKEAEVYQLLPELSSKLNLFAASEYMMDDYFVQLFKEEELLTIKGKYVLVEMSYLNAPVQLFEILFDLQVAGYIPVLAHPERYIFFHNNLDMYKKLKSAGCLFQMNLLSPLGYYGENVAKAADMLLGNSLIDFTGSDVHHKQHISFFEKPLRIKNVDPFKEALKNNEFFK